MKRRSKISGKPLEAQYRKSSKLKRSKAQKVTAGRGAVAAGEKPKVARFSRELNEALEQQSATANVLRMISGSPSDIQPVLETIVRTAGELCAAEYAMLFRLRDGKYHVACSNNAAEEYVRVFL